MKKCKRKEWLIGLLWLGIVCMGCAGQATEPAGNNEETDVSVQNEEEPEENATEAEDARQQDGTDKEIAPQQSESEQEPEAQENSTDLTFEDLSKQQFWFSSGAGGWADEFVIEKDGFFSGVFHDSDMGSTGEGYPCGTLYSSTYFGYFTDLTKVDEYTYKMTRSDISYKEELGTEEILDEILHVYTEAYALGGNDTFYVYLPGTPVSQFSEEIWMWLRDGNESETELTMPVIVDEENQLGICSYERMSPADEARMAYESYKESFDAYETKLTEAMTTLEMNEAAAGMYEVSDQCLNELWSMIKYHVSQELYDEILAQQREWIAEKEMTQEASAEEFEGGSLAPVDTMITQAEMTMQRCQELLQYIENNCKTPDE